MLLQLHSLAPAILPTLFVLVASLWFLWIGVTFCYQLVFTLVLNGTMAHFDLQLAKMLRYIDSSTLCDITFTFFLVSWFFTRHVLYIFVIVSTYYDCPRLIPFEWTPERDRYLSKPAWIVFVTLLSALQVNILFNVQHNRSEHYHRYFRPSGSG